MRKIVSKADQKKKQRRNQIIVSGILIFVMFFSVLGYSFYGGDGEASNKIEYNGYEFVKYNEIWYLSLGDFNFVFRNNPEEVGDFDVELNYLDSYSGKPLYISSQDKSSEIEILANLQQVVQRAQYACLNKSECEGDLPIKTCENNFIVIEVYDENEIIQEDNCVFIRGEEEKLLELSDLFLLKILGVK